MINRIKLYFELRRYKQIIANEPDPSLRAHAMYSYVERTLGQLCGRRQPTVGEYLLLTSYIVANLMDTCVNRQDVNGLIKDIRHNASVILNENRQARGNEEELH